MWTAGCRASCGERALFPRCKRCVTESLRGLPEHSEAIRGLEGSEVLTMSDERGLEPVEPRTCERCGKRMPPQKRGRPRKWCSQQCRQSAYEARNGLPSWKDQQPKVEDLSDVVEAAQDAAARRVRPIAQVAREGVHRPGYECQRHVAQSPIDAACVIDTVTRTIQETGIPNEPRGRHLAESVVALVNAVLERTAGVFPADAFPGFNPKNSQD